MIIDQNFPFTGQYKLLYSCAVIHFILNIDGEGGVYIKQESNLLN